MCTKIYYLQYILNFIDNEYKICDTINDTYFSKSISGIDSDSYYKIQGNCYQFIYKSNYCTIKSVKKNNRNKIYEKLWMKQTTQYIYDKINNNTSQELSKYIIKKNDQSDEQKICYVREIDINMIRGVYEKIVNDPNDEKKDYNSNDLFFLCYSYGFSSLDNSLIILKNILHLIIQKKFKLNDINREFIYYFSIKNHNSKYFKKLIMDMPKYDDCDIQSIIDKFLYDNFDFISTDNFLNELFQWITKLSNLFTLIKQTFYFSILTDNKDLISKVCCNVDSKIIFNISFQNIDTIMLLLLDDCMISCISFTNHTKLLYSKFTNSKDYINIDITEFYIKLYGLENNELINEKFKFNNFLSYLNKEPRKTTVFHINKTQLIIEYNVEISQIEVSKKNENDLFSINELLLVSNKILILKLFQENDVLYQIAYMIVIDFMNQGSIENHDFSISHYETRNDTTHHGNILCLNSLSNQPILQQIKWENRNNFVRTVYLCGSEQVKFQLLGIENLHQKYTNFDFIGGIFEGEFSLFELRSVYENNELELKSDFVAKMSNLFDTNDFNRIKLQKLEEYFDFLEDHDDDSVMFLKYSIDSNVKQINSLSTIIVNHEKENIYKFSRIYHKTPKQILKNPFEVYHDTILTDDDYNLEKISSKSIPSVKKISFSYFYQFEIINSNFHILISRIIELKSMNKDKSTVKKSYIGCISKLKIEHCKIKFLTANMMSFDDLDIEHCDISANKNLFFNFTNHQELNIKIRNSYSYPILISNFIYIQFDNKTNYIDYANKYLESCLIVNYSSVNLINEIPNNFLLLFFNKCEKLSVKNNILLKSHLLLPKNIEIINLQNIYTQISSKLKNELLVFRLKISECKLPHGLYIIGVYDCIDLEKCSSLIVINSFCNFFHICDHQDEYIISNIVSKAIPKKHQNVFLLNEQSLKIVNLEIECLKNIKIQSIQIINSSIQRFSNVMCKFIDMQNIRSLFTIKTADKSIIVVHNPITLKKTDDEFMFLQTYD